MGLLKFSSIYKKNKKKEAAAPPPAPSIVPKIEPISLELNLDLSDTTIKKTSIIEQQQQQQKAVPAGSGSLFTDIFSELKTPPAVTQQGKNNTF